MEPPQIDPRVGLCSACAHVEIVISTRGSTFYRCRVADCDPRFAKYPQLPVVACSAYERRHREDIR